MKKPLMLLAILLLIWAFAIIFRQMPPPAVRHIPTLLAMGMVLWLPVEFRRHWRDNTRDADERARIACIYIFLQVIPMGYVLSQTTSLLPASLYPALILARHITDVATNWVDFGAKRE